jgi:hypothetical protein
MNGKDSLIYLFIAAFVAVLTTGLVDHELNLNTFIIFCFIAVPVLITYFFDSRKNPEPSKIEKIAATFWLIFRRFICFVAALFFFGVAVKLAFFSEVLFNEFWLSLCLICAAALCVWVGVYGQGWQRGAWKDDVALHSQNKARYKWPW